MNKYRNIFNILRREIEEGKYAGKRRLPSEAELCLRFKVSRPTAGRALRELQQIGKIERKAGAGNYLTASGSPPSLKLGLFVPGLGNTEILDPMCNEISRFAQSLGCSVLQEDSTNPAQDGPHALQICRQLIEMRVSGVFFSPMESVPDRAVWNRRIADEFLKNGIPLLLLDRDIDEFPVRSEFDLVGIDNVAAGIEITSHLIGEGLRRICFLARKHYPSTTDLRLMGCREAIRRSGESLRDASAHFGDPTDAEFVKRMLEKDKPDAVLCSNDQTAALLIRTLGQLQIRVPADIAVAGFDDVQYATLLAPPLTTIKQPYRELGRSAVTMLLERIANPALSPRQVLHSHQLMVRQSTDRRSATQRQARQRVASA